MSGESTTRTAPRTAGTGTARAGGGRLGERLSGVAMALGLVLFLGGFAWGAVVYRPYTVPTSSMTPTIDAGDRVLAQRVDGTEVRRGDVVV
ncbi:S26 family signal peptidase, partial [Streptomyces sp. SAS_269]